MLLRLSDSLPESIILSVPINHTFFLSYLFIYFGDVIPPPGPLRRSRIHNRRDLHIRQLQARRMRKVIRQDTQAVLR